jgi:hypothetical protein
MFESCGVAISISKQVIIIIIIIIIITRLLQVLYTIICWTASHTQRLQTLLFQTYTATAIVSSAPVSLHSCIADCYLTPLCALSHVPTVSNIPLVTVYPHVHTVKNRFIRYLQVKGVAEMYLCSPLGLYDLL